MTQDDDAKPSDTQPPTMNSGDAQFVRTPDAASRKPNQLPSINIKQYIPRVGRGAKIVGIEIGQFVLNLILGRSNNLQQQQLIRNNLLKRAKTLIEEQLMVIGPDTRRLKLKLVKPNTDSGRTADEHKTGDDLPVDQPIFDDLIFNYFNKVGQALLILGEPGSGKTCTLLKLAQQAMAQAEQVMAQVEQAMAQAEQTPTWPILPIMVSLSAWPRGQAHFMNWLLEQLEFIYQVPKYRAREWIKADQLLLLLDGLDEVHPDEQAACVTAINQFRELHGLSGIVICCRTETYQNLIVRPNIHSALVMSPLSDEQIKQYLSVWDVPLVAYGDNPKDDEIFDILMRSPLMLNIITNSFRTYPPRAISVPMSLEAQRLFDLYVERALQRHPTDKTFSPQQTITWLSWLARMMPGQALFYVERLQPDWLSEGSSRWAFTLGIALLGGMLHMAMLALAGWLAGVDELATYVTVSGLTTILTSLLVAQFKRHWVATLTIALCNITLSTVLIGSLTGETNGFFAGGILGMLATATGVQMADNGNINMPHAVVWSYSRMLYGLFWGSLIGLALSALIIGVARSLGQPAELSDLLALAWLCGIGFMLLWGRSQIIEQPEEKIAQRSGIKHTAQLALGMGTSYGIITALFFVTLGWLSSKPGELEAGRLLAIFLGLLLGFLLALFAGGAACIQHVVLRGLLSRVGCIPWKLAQFLDYAASHALLQRVGGGYYFRHGSWQAYFATLR